jgi:exonuclease SbcD
MLTFVHTADIHFGMENYGKIDLKTGIHSRLLDFAKALDACIDFAIEKNVSFFLFSGDAYKTAYPSPTQQKLFLERFFKLYAANIPVVIIVGNHDHPLSFGKANAMDVFKTLPIDGFYVINKPTSFVLKTKDGPVSIVGIPWPTKNTLAITQEFNNFSAEQITDYISEKVAFIIESFRAQLNPNLPAVLAGHLTVANGIFSGSEKRAIYGNDPTLLPSQLAKYPFDYVGLGHLHRYQNLNPNGYPAIIYSGSPERVDFGERKEDKGFCYVQIPSKGDCVHEFIKTPTRKFIQLDVKLQGEINQTEQIIKELARYQINESVIKINYYLEENCNDFVNIKQIQTACAAAMHLVSINPVYKICQRTARSLKPLNMDFDNLVNHYLSGRPELTSRAEIIKKKIGSLQEILANLTIENSD